MYTSCDVYGAAGVDCGDQVTVHVWSVTLVMVTPVGGCTGEPGRGGMVVVTVSEGADPLYAPPTVAVNDVLPGLVLNDPGGYVYVY